MNTGFVVSADGTRIAYETAGSGTALMLLHGGGQNRGIWQRAGWLPHLTGRFRVIAVDLRGHGDSDKPMHAAAYAIDRLCDDILSVADAAGVSRFSLWGYSYGGNIGRYLAARSRRLERFAMIGVSFGPPVDDAFRQTVLEMREHWKSLVEADRAGTLDVATLPEPERALWLSGQVPVMLTWLGALLEWPPVEPEEVRCPTLWVAGTLNTACMRGVDQYRARLDSTPVRVAIVNGLTHADELAKVDRMIPPLLEFMDAT